MILTIFLAIVICGAVALMMLAGVAFIQDTKMFSSAPKEFREVLKPREKELFYGARAIGWLLLYKKSAFQTFDSLSCNLCVGSVDMYTG